MVVTPDSGKKIHIETVDAHFIVFGHQLREAGGDIRQIVAAQVQGAAGTVNDRQDIRRRHPWVRKR